MHTAINLRSGDLLQSPSTGPTSRTSACSKTRTANSVSGIKSCRISRSFIRMTAHFPTAGRTFPRISPRLQRHYRRYADLQGCQGHQDQAEPACEFYCVSCTPWTAFTGCGSRVADGQPAYFPIVVMGRYEKCGDKVNMPVNITIAHAVADGYHAGLFFRYLQEELDALH